MILLLELARGVAALWVFFFHTKALFESSSSIIYQLSAYGSLGVPMFFVISGYVITYSAESSLKKNKSPLVFLKNRFLRIYPTFWASVMIVIIAPYVIELISSLKSGEYIMPSNILSKFNYIEWSNLLMLSKVFWATSNDLQGEFNTINAVYWTLAIEFQFYIVVFIALLFGKYYRYIIAVVSLVSLVMIFNQKTICYGLFIPYWPSFFVGILLAYLHRNGIWFSPEVKIKSFLFVISFVVIIVFVNLISHKLPSIIASFFFACCFGMFLWIISDFESILLNIKRGSNRLLYWLLESWLILGAMSYSVYLLHGKLYLVPFMFVRQVLEPTNILFGLLTILGTLLICYPFYYFVERNFLSKNYNKIHKDVLSSS